jgi:hypothetical protein
MPMPAVLVLEINVFATPKESFRVVTKARGRRIRFGRLSRGGWIECDGKPRLFHYAGDVELEAEQTPGERHVLGLKVYENKRGRIRVSTDAPSVGGLSTLTQGGVWIELAGLPRILVTTDRSQVPDLP